MKKTFITFALLFVSLFTFAQQQTIFSSTLQRTKQDINIDYVNNDITIVLDKNDSTLQFIPAFDGEWTEQIQMIDTFYTIPTIRTIQVWTDNGYYELRQYRIGESKKWRTIYILEYPYGGMVEERKYTMTLQHADCERWSSE